tara:strand:+ start:82 stop:495 length:414 start_codon:yes stop_codon:yes gene_type:complete
LDWSAKNIHKQRGVVLEFGLGNGRTFDHMRKLLPQRDIAAHPDCIPHPAFQFIGDFRDSIPRAIEQLGRSAALAHLDIGTGQKNTSLALASKITPCIEKLLCVNAIVVSEQEVERWRSYKLQLPAGISENRIHLYRL